VQLTKWENRARTWVKRKAGVPVIWVNHSGGRLARLRKGRSLCLPSVRLVPFVQAIKREILGEESEEESEEERGSGEEGSSSEEEESEDEEEAGKRPCCSRCCIDSWLLLEGWGGAGIRRSGSSREEKESEDEEEAGEQPCSRRWCCIDGWLLLEGGCGADMRSTGSRGEEEAGERLLTPGCVLLGNVANKFWVRSREGQDST